MEFDNNNRSLTTSGMRRRRHPLPLPNTPTFDINDNATEAEQRAVFEQGESGIVPHGYTGVDSSVGFRNPDGTFGQLVISNRGSLVVAPNQVNSGSETQEVVTASGQTKQVSRVGGVISAGNELVTGGMGLSPNILLNIPSADGMYQGNPIWNYSPMERIDALPVYQANRARYLDRLADIVESDQYDFFIVSIPANAEDMVIGWKDTWRDQLTVPPESMLVMILADTVAGGK